MADIIDYYKSYEHYALAWFRGSSRHLMFQNWLRGSVKPGGRILDIGCGDGSYAEWMPEFNWTGIDIGEPKVPYCGTRLVADIEKGPYDLESGSFDAVICSEVLEHLWTPEEVHKEAHRLLKSGGTYIISTPNFHWIEHTLKGFEQILYDPKRATHTKEHIRFYTVPTHVRLLHEAGFQAQDFQGADLQWGEFFQEARCELKKVLANYTDGEVDLLLGKMFRSACHTVGVISVKC